MKISTIYRTTILCTISIISTYSWACADASFSGLNPTQFKQLGEIQAKIDDTTSGDMSAEDHQAIKNMLDKLEGPEIYHESDGNYTRWGIGDGNSAGLHPHNLSQAANMFYDRYIEHTPFHYAKPVMKAMQKLGPDEVYAWAQLVLHRPAWADSYAKAWAKAGNSFEDVRFVDYFLSRQRHDYIKKTAHRKYLAGFMKRIHLSREGGYSGNFNLQSQYRVVDKTTTRAAIARESNNQTTVDTLVTYTPNSKETREQSVKKEAVLKRSAQVIETRGTD
jgi:hypothetical protein